MTAYENDYLIFYETMMQYPFVGCTIIDMGILTQYHIDNIQSIINQINDIKIDICIRPYDPTNHPNSYTATARQSPNIELKQTYSMVCSTSNNDLYNMNIGRSFNCTSFAAMIFADSVNCIVKADPTELKKHINDTTSNVLSYSEIFTNSSKLPVSKKNSFMTEAGIMFILMSLKMYSAVIPGSCTRIKIIKESTDTGIVKKVPDPIKYDDITKMFLLIYSANRKGANHTLGDFFKINGKNFTENHTSLLRSYFKNRHNCSKLVEPDDYDYSKFIETIAPMNDDDIISLNNESNKEQCMLAYRGARTKKQLSYAPSGSHLLNAAKNKIKESMTTSRKPGGTIKLKRRGSVNKRNKRNKRKTNGRY